MISRAQRYKNIYKIETLYANNISNQRMNLIHIKRVRQNITILIKGITAKFLTKKEAIMNGEISKPDKMWYVQILMITSSAKGLELKVHPSRQTIATRKK